MATKSITDNPIENVDRLASAPRAICSPLSELTDFGSNPGELSGYFYLPEVISSSTPLVVVLHGCAQTADDYDHGTGWSQIAKRAGFALVFAEQPASNNALQCINWFNSDDIARAGGEAESIAQMTETLVIRHGLNKERVYVTGFSAGGAMAMAMIVTRPDLFVGGAVIGGLA
ncbi:MULTISPECIES: extracellular catalytic domain type 1 short-chain-length polyhydroxyalkanoate depolymerase [unclassified Rhizobium]|uniref:extracellular catalytic domain type 1 short-chain-length polyhydroxyalkanoate depolymerase n=1 Tax=unclassified Rhizobium TaxID=2613769 RepID=UPI001ADAD27E|nr:MULTISPECIES: PHB depolymerase family esterase [unclassified Rhizobium]MBO9102391.1 PHB depolymerase family esterase [Rhizobium sp. L58/93]MBO9172438.1 PHB depolymerase family esterase [Rhizobium sp. L245/93]QXZ88240.1 PHB depolymerase family esterase [Rhizobium sp. K1/93]QXZ94211.1 PHB depolymerase family esterase [Rhizobium sp. K15/93]QYA05691.1 PHB depolymerase family esterase [Rhizobium sp. B21/90]